ncbi:MAG: T9SS type A sorting domain-containing protein, partial [bacterium]|nr:T9SS type A sorting domain-containing protein [bacterium]
DRSVCRTDSFRTPSPESLATVPCSLSPVPELRLQTSLGELRTALPSVYQVSANGSRTEIEAAFELTDKNTFGITLPNGYNPDHSLRIDPLIYSTYLGGISTDDAFGIISDRSGESVVTGSTLSTNFPTTSGVGDTTFNGASDCFITKLNNIGSQLVYSTYIGGWMTEVARGIAGDGFGGVIITGYTSSFDFPADGFFHNTGNPSQPDCFVTRLNSTGSQMIYSIFIGGYSRDIGNQVIHDGSGGAIVVGLTSSADFPVTPTAFDTTYNAGNDCFVIHINNTTNIIYSTYLGGSGSDIEVEAISDGSGGVIIVGETTSTNFPTTTSAFDTSYNSGQGDGFITHLNTTGTDLIFSTFLGGSDQESSSGVVIDENGSIIVVGATSSPNFPVTVSAFDTSLGGTRDSYIARFNNDCSQLLCCTFIGGSDVDGAARLAISNNGSIIICGGTSSMDIPITPNAQFPVYFGGGWDIFLAQLNGTLTQLTFCSYFGGSGEDYIGDIVNDNNGGFVVAGSTTSPNFPITQNAFDTTYDSLGGYPTDCFVTRLRFDTVDVAREIDIQPKQFSLSQNYPNPFNSSTTISYSLPKSGNVDLRLFDITGREVATLVNQKQQTGSYRVTFDGKNLSSGTYFVRMQVGEFVKTQKMVLLR